MAADVSMRAYQAGGDLVLSDERTLDAAQASGRWIAVDRSPDGGEPCERA